MNAARLARLGQRRREALHKYTLAHNATRNALVDELAGRPSGERNLKQAAELTGLTRRTIYNLLRSAAARRLAEERNRKDTP